ncbi:MAG: hypothetical protein GX299_07765 [Epulopiscium sp.]|nr:hypothetical protein [Candidatus Epulonipiscium sp.]
MKVNMIEQGNQFINELQEKEKILHECIENQKKLPLQEQLKFLYMAEGVALVVSRGA